MNKAILHTIIIYTLSYCPYCIKAKALLDDKKVAYQEIEVSNFTAKEKDKLIQKAGGKKTVPQIFIDDIHIGGCDDLYELEKEGKLDKLLEKPAKKEFSCCWCLKVLSALDRKNLDVIPRLDRGIHKYLHYLIVKE